MGAYHTIDLELNRKFTLSKDHWDFVALERIGELRLSMLLTIIVEIL
jgi:stalled ribosome rescue protein Dom34